jgi:hypothetical protein
VEEGGASVPAVDVSIHLMVDSSPQAGVNWLMITHTVITSVTKAAVMAWEFQSMMEESENYQAAEALQDTIASLISCHTLPPVGLASGRADVLHETHALYHALFLETGTPELLSRKLDVLTSITTDLGTESHFAQVPPAPFSAWFPHIGTRTEDQLRFEPDADIQTTLVAEQQPTPTVAVADPLISLQRALPIAGGLHMISNATKSMLNAMPHFSEHIEGKLDALVSFLHAGWSRRRFVITCLRSEAAEAYAPLFSSFGPSLVRWRRGSLAEVARALEPLEAPLRTYWSRDH